MFVGHGLVAFALAASVASARALDVHSDEIHLPPKFMFVYILLFVLAFGVLWEVIEFTLGELARLTDSMLDLVFDTIGAVVVAVWGTAHLAGVSGYIADQLEARSAD
jgi:VanZ family protein